MTQEQALKRVLDFEAYVTLKWPEYGETMRYCILQSRNRVIKELQAIQLKEFKK